MLNYEDVMIFKPQQVQDHEMQQLMRDEHPLQ